MQPFLLLDCNLSPESGETFVNAVKRLAPVESTFVVVRLADLEEPDWVPRVLAGEFCGIVISGSGASPTEELPWILRLLPDIRKATETGIPTLGICFGHQLLAYAWGGEVGEDVLGYKVRGIQAVTIKDDGSLTPQLIAEGKGELEVLASHRDQVTKAPPGWKVVGYSSYCPVQALRAPDLPILSVQWHPEGDPQFIVDNPHPDWDNLPDVPLVNLSGNQVLAGFLRGLSGTMVR